MTPAEFDPARTWVFAVSVTEYRDRSYEALPTSTDIELITYFRKRGVPDDRITFLRDWKATLLGIRTAFNALLPRARKGDLLFLYFNGHGGKGYFCPYDAGDDPSVSHWGIAEILTRIDSFFGGDRVILTADTCYSGCLATALKARTRREKSYTVLASTSSRAQSKGYTFTRCLIDGLKGKTAIDFDADGRVTLKELGKYTAAAMKSDVQQTVTYATFGRSREDLVLASIWPRADGPTQASVEARGLQQGQQVVSSFQASTWRGSLVSQMAGTLIPAEPPVPVASFVDTQQVVTRPPSSVRSSIRAVAGRHGTAGATATSCACCS